VSGWVLPALFGFITFAEMAKYQKAVLQQTPSFLGKAIASRKEPTADRQKGQNLILPPDVPQASG